MEESQYDRCNRCSMRLTVECSAEGKMLKSGASQKITAMTLYLFLIPSKSSIFGKFRFLQGRCQNDSESVGPFMYVDKGGKQGGSSSSK